MLTPLPTAALAEGELAEIRKVAAVCLGGWYGFTYAEHVPKLLHELDRVRAERDTYLREIQRRDAAFFGEPAAAPPKKETP